MAGLLAAALAVEEETRTVDAEWEELPNKTETERDEKEEETPHTTSSGEDDGGAVSSLVR